MTFKKPMIATIIAMVAYLLVFTFVASNSASNLLVIFLAFLITVPFLGIVIFAISSAFCVVFCRAHKIEIAECHKSISMHVSNITGVRKGSNDSSAS